MKATGGEEPVCGEAEATARADWRALIGQGPMPQVGGLRPLEGRRTRKFRGVLIGQGPMLRGEIQGRITFFVASGLPR